MISQIAIYVKRNISVDTRCDVLIDATINNAVSLYLDELVTANAGVPQPLIGHFATDSATATLGLLIVRAPGSPHTLAQLDALGLDEVEVRRDLQSYARLWADPEPGEEIVPARGCSVPTFHGSAADLAVSAAALLNLLAEHIGSERSGVHLISPPQLRRTAHHAYIAAQVG